MNTKEECKRKRSENWVEEDKMLLKELIKEKVKIIENKNTDINTNHSKRKAWMDVTDSFNNLCAGGQRTVTQLKNQWVATKIAAKKKISERRKEIGKTGGGSIPAEEPLSSEDIMVWLPNEFVVDFNEFDYDAVIIQANQATTSNENCEKVVEEEIEKGQNVTNATPVIKKKMSAKRPAEYHMKDMVEFDIKCRDELHKRQIQVEEARLEVEKRKLRNLDLEYELLKEKMEYFKKHSVDK